MRKPSEHRNVELVGLPATGKSHYRNLHTKNGVYKSTHVPSLFARFCFAAFFTAKHPFVTAHFFRLTIIKKQIAPNYYHKIMKLLIPALAREGKAEWLGACLIDEGLFQYLFSLYEEDVTIPELETDVSFLGSLSRDVIFMRSSSHEQREHRMIERGRKFRSYMSETERSVFNEVLKRNEEPILQFLQRHFQTKEVINDYEFRK